MEEFYKRYATVTHFAVLLIVGTLVTHSLVNVINSEAPGSLVAAVVASDAKPAPVATIAELNALVRAAAKQYASATPEEKKTLSDALFNLLQERKQAVLSLMQQDPHAILTGQLPASTRSALPADLQNMIESVVDFNATISVIHADTFVEGQEIPLQYFAVSATTGKRYEVHFDGPHPDLITGAKARLHGVLLDSQLAVAGNSGGTTVTAAGTVAASTNQQTIVILVSFNNVAESFTVDQIASTTFTGGVSSAAFYSENSNGAVNLTGNVVGPYTINYTMPSSMTNAECQNQMYNWASLADKAASTGGANLSSYVHKVYALPSGSCPGYGGQGTIGGNPSQTWIYGYNGASIYSHELGHNLGVHHANSFDCGTTQIAPYSGCINTEYGDSSDVMGGGYDQFNAPHKVAMGWAAGSEVQTVTTSGTYTIAPLESNSGVEVLKIAKPNTSDAYYISYRQPLGQFDTNTNMINYWSKGVEVHIWSGTASIQTKLVDTTPGDSSHVNDTLLDGTAFGDPATGVKITQVSHSSTGAVVNIAIGSYTDTIAPTAVLYNSTCLSCVYTNGIVSGQPSFTVKAGDDVGVTKVELYKDGTLLGTDTSSPYTFTWDTTLETDGSVHTLQAKAYDAAGNIGSSSTATVTVDNTPPTVAVSSPLASSTLVGTVTIKAPASDNKGLSSISVYIDGVYVYGLGLGSTLSYTLSYAWNTTLTSDGAHTIQATARDSAGNISASPIVIVTTANNVADTIAPTTGITSPLNGASVTGYVIVSASSQDNIALSKVETLRDGAVICTQTYSGVSTASGSCSWNSAADMNGSHTLQTRAYDPSGNVGLSAPITVNVTGGLTDTVAPTVPQNVAGSALSDTQTSLTWSSSTDNVAVTGYYVYRNGTKVGSPSTPSYTDTGLTGATTYQYTVAAHDAAGNTSAQSTAVAVTTQSPIIDATAPSVTITSPTSGAKLKGNGNVNVAVSASDSSGIASIVIAIDGTTLKTCTNATSCSYAWPGKTITAGSHTITATATDSSSNQNKSTASVTVTK